MSLSNILAITGKPGLYQLKTKTRTGFIVESLLDNKTAVIGINHNVSVLKDISIYTYEAEVPLVDVFKRISDKENGGASINHKTDKNTLTSYFSEVLPDFDEDRVYASDIKKVVQWYNLLHNNDMLTAAIKNDEEE